MDMAPSFSYSGLLPSCKSTSYLSLSPQNPGGMKVLCPYRTRLALVFTLQGMLSPAVFLFLAFVLLDFLPSDNHTRIFLRRHQLRLRLRVQHGRVSGGRLSSCCPTCGQRKPLCCSSKWSSASSCS